MTTIERSVSRGREFVSTIAHPHKHLHAKFVCLPWARQVSTGRGGVGNLVRDESTSRGRVSRERDGDERGRELSPTNPGRVCCHSFSLQRGA